MPPKTITCCICNEQVSKRSTLSLGDKGRACRDHEITELTINQQVADKKMQQSEWFLKKIMLVTMYRVENTKRGLEMFGMFEYPMSEFVGIMYNKMQLTKQQVTEVVDEIKERGYRLTPDEILQAMITGAQYQKNKKENYEADN